MKTQIKNINYIILLVLLVSITSCSENDAPSEPTVSELLAHKWFLDKYEDTSKSPSEFYEADSCEKNDYYFFKSDGYLLSEGFRVKKNMNDPDCDSSGIRTFAYVLNEKERLIEVVYDTQESDIFTIITLTETDFVFSEVNGSLRKYYKR